MTIRGGGARAGGEAVGGGAGWWGKDWGMGCGAELGRTVAVGVGELGELREWD